MHLSDKPQFATLLISVAELYRQKLSIASLEIYWRCLQQYPLDELQKALDAHAKHPDQGRFMPQPADVIRLLEGDHVTQALRAWGKVTNAIREIGCYDAVVFDDSIIHNVISEMGGWIQLCRMTERELPFRAREFEKRYVFYLNRKPNNHPKQLTGLFKHSAVEPILFGNVNLALCVYQQGDVVDGLLKPQKTLLTQASKLIKNQNITLYFNDK